MKNRDPDIEMEDPDAFVERGWYAGLHKTTKRCIRRA